MFLCTGDDYVTLLFFIKMPRERKTERERERERERRERVRMWKRNGVILQWESLSKWLRLNEVRAFACIWVSFSVCVCVGVCVCVWVSVQVYLPVRARENENTKWGREREKKKVKNNNKMKSIIKSWNNFRNKLIFSISGESSGPATSLNLDWHCPQVGTRLIPFFIDAFYKYKTLFSLAVRKYNSENP